MTVMVRIRARGYGWALGLASLACLLGEGPARGQQGQYPPVQQGQYVPAAWPPQSPPPVLVPPAPPQGSAGGPLYSPGQAPPAQSYVPYAQPAPGYPQGGSPAPYYAPPALPPQPAPVMQPPAAGPDPATGQQFAPQFQNVPVQSRTVIVGMQQTSPWPPTQMSSAPQPPPPAMSSPGVTQPIIIHQLQMVPGQSGAPAIAGQPPMAPLAVSPGATGSFAPAFAPADLNGQKLGEAMKPGGDLWTNLPFTVDFKDGVFFKTNDDFFSLRINNLLQVDYRDFSHTAQGAHTATSLQDNFTLAREWLIFRGNVSEFVDYTTIIAGGAAGTPTGPAAMNVLDAYLDLSPFGKDAKELLQIRMGRFKTPFLYQFYKVAPQDYVTPELSMYSTNFLQNRELGIMAHGLLFDKRLDYAVGAFNGAPNTFEVNQSDREGICYLGFQPFAKENNSIFKNLILAGSYAFGEQNGPVDPGALGTAVPSNGPPDNLLISPTFLQFGPTTTQTGSHQFWAAEVIWAVRSFNLYAEYTGGQQSYGLTTAPGKSFPVSLSGYSVSASYFVTGEEITPDRRRVKPLRPYDWNSGAPGAVEPFFRYSNLVLGSNVFSDHLANPAVFANRVNATDVGVNWYQNEYVKVVFDWQHAMFNQPVSFTGAVGGNARRNEDLLWLRLQLYY